MEVEDCVISLIVMIALFKYYAIETDHLTSVLFSRGDCVTESGELVLKFC